MKIRINKVHFPVTVLGPGRRLGIWLQGCSIHCPGCLSRDTWPADSASEIEVESLLSLCQVITGGKAEGVTISGGEPFEQPEALAALLRGLRAWRGEGAREFDILCYSGLSLEQLKHENRHLLSMLDAIIPEPYQCDARGGKIWRGSSNQPLVPLSVLGHERYDHWIEAEPKRGKGAFQMCVDSKQIWYIGIPAHGDLEVLRQNLIKRGIAQVQASWLA